MIELALIGAGTMGANHARVAMALRDARLTVVVDPDEAAGKQLAERTGARYSNDHHRIVGMVDAAIVAVPTEHHAAVACDLLSAGIDVLVEKPFASSVEEGRQMVELAREKGRILAAGHVERFNPVILELDTLVVEPIHVEAHRVGPYTPRIRDGVTLDLMIHDLDIVAAIAKSPLRAVQALQRDVVGKDDLAVALLEFESGMTATVTASRLGQDKVRELSITQSENVIRADLIRQSLTVHRVGRVESTDDGRGFRQTGIVEVPFLLHRGEPLLIELGHFLDCILERTPPRVSGEDGLASLEMVDRVRQAATRESR